MPADSKPPDPDHLEEVERRTNIRGPVRDLTVNLPDGEQLAVLEAGKRGVFVALHDPDRYPLGHRLDITVTSRGRSAAGRAEVVRKEIDPRRGIALLIVHMSPDAEAEYQAMMA